ncbi:MAG: 2-oxoacid:ferredoxin oxidoreductase subunit beta [Planctomycetota bacterium]|nr:MAG: 2-oxoacid:ferredoxin oxidoreductase subunit beta [Planctomycetota bacterium]
MTSTTARLTRKDFASDQDVRWCPGCGDYAILRAVQNTLPELGVPREKIVFISGIGCSSRFPYYMNTYGFHTIHGRAPTIATGLKLTDPELVVFVITGDGDGLSIGGNHLLHVLRRNVNLNILLFNNRIYGLTKGQYSPTSEQGKVTKSTPYGSIDRPLDPIRVALGANATWIARTIDRFVPHMQQMLRRAVAHPGTAFLEIYQNCNIFNDGAFAELTDKRTRSDNVLEVEHGKPLRFGSPEAPKALRLSCLDVEIATCDPETGACADPWIYDATDPRHASLLTALEHPPYPVPIGVLLERQAPEFVASHLAQEREVIERLGPGDLAAMLRGHDTWRVE